MRENERSNSFSDCAWRSVIQSKPTPSPATSQFGEPSPVARGAFISRLFEPVDIASLVFFRIAFGVVIIYEVWLQFSRGWIKLDYIDPDYHFRTTGSVGCSSGRGTACTCTSSRSG